MWTRLEATLPDDSISSLATWAVMISLVGLLLLLVVHEIRDYGLSGL